MRFTDLQKAVKSMIMEELAYTGGLASTETLKKLFW